MDNTNHQGTADLMKAIESKDLKAVKLVADNHKLHNQETLPTSKEGLDSGETINCLGQGLFDVGTKTGMLEVIKLSLHTKHKQSPLMEAALRADVELIQMLMDSEFYDFHKEDSSGDTTFLQNFFQTKKGRNLAIDDVDIPVVQILLENGAAVNESEKKQTQIIYEPPLITAIKTGSLGLVQLMCEYGAKLDVTEKLPRKPPLDLPGESGKTENIQTLVNKESATLTGDPVLLTSIQHGKNISFVVEIVKVLLEKGANVNNCNSKGLTPLMAAARTWESPELLNTLLLHGADFNTKDSNRNTAFLYAVKGNFYENAKFLIELEGSQTVDIDEQNSSGSTALILAAKNNHKAIFHLLISRGANVNIQDEQGETALASVAKFGDGDTLKKIIERGADIDHVNRERFSAVMFAAQNTWASISNLNVLFLHGADVNIKDNMGNTVLLQAIEQRRTDIAKFLIEHEGDQKIDVDAQNTSGTTALTLAIQHRMEPIINLLIAQGANVNVEDNNGDTALTLAATYRDSETIKKLIKRGANINHQNKEGYSALMIAASNYHKDSMEALLKAGADVNVVSHGHEKKTAISSLFEAGKRDDIMLIIVIDLHLVLDSLLDKGASSNYLKPDALFDFIQSNQLRLVPKLISSGFGPAELSSEEYLHDLEERVAFPVVSPFMFALLYSHPKLARYFDGNWFLSTSDIQLQAKHDTFKEILEWRSNEECVEIFNEFCSQPMSLLKLSFMAVSSAIGCVPDREERVEKLPLPPIIKDKLLFKKQEVQLDIPESATPSRESPLSSHISRFLALKSFPALPSRRYYWRDNYEIYDCCSDRDSCVY